MRRLIVWIVGLVIAGTPGLQAQGGLPKPGPEHKRLEYFVGKWTATGEMKANPFGPAGKIASTDSCDWFQGGFAVVCQSEGTSPAGPTRGLGIMSYSPDHKVYTYYGVDNTGMIMMSAARGTIQGDTWTFTEEGTMGGQPYKSRFTLQTASPASYSFTWELLGADKKWTQILQGTATRASKGK